MNPDDVTSLIVFTSVILGFLVIGCTPSAWERWLAHKEEMDRVREEREHE